MREVAKDLRVPPEYILKYMGYELGSNIIIRDTVYSINGEFMEADILKQLDKFIDKFILCAKCKLPESVMQLN